MRMGHENRVNITEPGVSSTGCAVSRIVEDTHARWTFKEKRSVQSTKVTRPPIGVMTGGIICGGFENDDSLIATASL